MYCNTCINELFCFSLRVMDHFPCLFSPFLPLFLFCLFFIIFLSSFLSIFHFLSSFTLCMEGGRIYLWVASPWSSRYMSIWPSGFPLSLTSTARFSSFPLYLCMSLFLPLSFLSKSSELTFIHATDMPCQRRLCSFFL